MNHSVKTTLLASGIVMACTVLAGCSSKSAAPVNNGAQNEVASNVPSNTGTTPSEPANNTTPSAPSNGSGAGGSQSSTTNPQDLVRESMDLAKKGKVIGVPFAVQSSMDAVQSLWGRADSQSQAGAGIYASYGAYSAALGFNKGGQIFDVRSFAKSLQTITLQDVEDILGKPGATRQSSDSYIYLYPAGADYQLLWVFPKTSSGRGQYVDHVSVFWPSGTINSMAATQAAPSVVIDNPPGTVGQLVTFSVKDVPKGYHLAELEWIPMDGSEPVVNTTDQAMDNGATGSSDSAFNISGDGQTLSFVYSSKMVGKSGVIRLIFQATSGAAMIGESEALTLK